MDSNIGGSGSDPTVSSYSYNSGHYTKIGRQVFAHIYMRIEAGGISGGSGDGIIKGLPFTAKSDGQTRSTLFPYTTLFRSEYGKKVLMTQHNILVGH